jgi:hypothetical protein
LPENDDTLALGTEIQSGSCDGVNGFADMLGFNTVD